MIDHRTVRADLSIAIDNAKGDLRGPLDALTATWLLLYGAAFVSSGAFSLRVIPMMGMCFMLFGVAAALLPLAVDNLRLGATFGGLHIIFGFIIARNYGG